MVAGQETHLTLSLNQPYNGGTFEYGNNDINFNENNILTGGGKKKRKSMKKRKTMKKRKGTKKRKLNNRNKYKKSKKYLESGIFKRKTLSSFRASLKKYL